MVKWKDIISWLEKKNICRSKPIYAKASHSFSVSLWLWFCCGPKKQISKCMFVLISHLKQMDYKTLLTSVVRNNSLINVNVAKCQNSIGFKCLLHQPCFCIVNLNFKLYGTSTQIRTMQDLVSSKRMLKMRSFDSRPPKSISRYFFRPYMFLVTFLCILIA